MNTVCNENNIKDCCQENDPDYSRRFQKHFPENKRGILANEFLKVVRAGETDPKIIVNQVWENTAPSKRCSDKSYIADFIKNYKYEALDYAEYYLRWEALPYEERKRIQQQRGAEYIKQHMEKQPATEKQIRYLTGVLEYKGILPVSKAEASDLINKMLVKKGWACDG